MMMSDDFDELGSESPTFRKQPSAIAVRKSQRPLFGLVQWNAFIFRDLVGRLKFVRQYPKINDNSNVVKQASKIRLRGITQIDFASQGSAHQGASQRVLPKHHRIETGFVSWEHVHHSARHGDIADVTESQTHDRSAQRIHFLPSTIEWRIRHLQALSCQ